MRVDKGLLREKIAETRHNEMGALILSVMGLIVVLAGLYIGTITATREEWRELVLYEVTYHPYVDIAITLAVLGLILMLLSAFIGIYYWYQRSKLMKQLESLK